MTTLEVPDAELVPLELRPVKRVTLGTARDAVARQDRLALGRPVCIPLDAATVDDDAKIFLSARPDSAFFLLGLTASFMPDDENPLKSAWVDVTMATSSPAGAAEPVAWSMKPMSADDPITVSRKVSFDGSLKFTAGPAEIGPSGGGEKDRTYVEHAVSLEALREGTNRPQWRFYTTEVTQIRGVHRLFLIVELDAAATGAADVSIGATVQVRRLKIFRYSAALEHLPDVARVALPPENRRLSSLASECLPCQHRRGP